MTAVPFIAWPAPAVSGWISRFRQSPGVAVVAVVKKAPLSSRHAAHVNSTSPLAIGRLVTTVGIARCERVPDSMPHESEGVVLGWDGEQRTGEREKAFPVHDNDRGGREAT